MAITGPEPIVAAAKARLDTDLAAFIDAVNAEATDGVVVDYPVAVFPFIPPRTLLTGFPVIGIQEGTYTLEDDTGWGATGVLPLTLVVYVQHSDPAVLAPMLRRLERAIMQCILQNRTLPPDGWGVRFLRSDPGPTLGTQEDPREYMSLRALTIEVRFEQDTP